MAAVQQAIDQVVAYPDSSPVVRGLVRGKVVSRFPYTLMYLLDDGVIVVLAVAHRRQRPSFWVDREL